MALNGTRHSIIDPDQGVTWRPAWVLRPLQDGVPTESTCTTITGELPGHFVLSTGSCRFPLVLSCSHPRGHAQARLFADMAYGFEIEPDTQQQRLLWALIVEKDRVLGYVNGDKPPRVPESREVVSDGNLTLCAIPRHESSPACYLACRSSPGGVRFLLLPAQASDYPAAAASSSLELDPLQLLVTGLQQRRRWAPAWFTHLDKGRIPIAAAAHEILRACLRSPAGRLKNLWVAEAPGGAERFVLNDLFAFCDTLSCINPHLSACVLQSALGLQRENGSLPAWYDPQTDTAAPYSSLPIIAQSALRVIRALEKPESLLAEIIHPLVDYLNWADQRYFDPRYNACLWPDEQECLIPELYDSQALAPDATALYLAELLAFKQLTPHLAQVIPHLSFDLEAREEQLRQSLSTVLRTTDSGFRGILLGDGTEIRRVGITQLMPIMVSDHVFPPPSRYWLRRLLFDHRLARAGGVSAWEKWDTDEIEPRIDLRAEYHLLDGLATAGFMREAESVAALLLPESAAAPPHPGAPAESAAVQGYDTSLAACLELKALSIHAGETSALPRSGALRSGMSSAQSHPIRQITLGLVGLVLAVLVALGGLMALRIQRRPPVSALGPKLAMADYDYHYGKPERAIPVYEEYFRIRPSFVTAFRLGNAWYKAGNYTNAIYWYNRALQMKPDYLPALLNRGLCLIRLNASSLAVRDFALATELAAQRGSRAALRRSWLATWLTRARLQESTDNQQSTEPE